MKQPDQYDHLDESERPLTPDEMTRYRRAVYAIRDAATFEALVDNQPEDFRADFRRVAFQYLRNSVKIELRRRARERKAKLLAFQPKVH